MGMSFDDFLAGAWAAHADDPAATAERLATQAPGLLTQASQLAPLAALVHHVCGEHLGDWAQGLAQLQRLREHPVCDGDADAQAAIARCRASLALCAGLADERAAMTASDRVRVTALAAANLAERDTARASALLAEALAGAEAAGLGAADPAQRALAVTANNLACTLEEKKSGRSAAERELMIAAAQAARRHWALAGTWLETERAEYRLAMTWLQAGDAAQAREHAEACLAIVGANGNPPLERFFGHEALALAERAAGHTEAAAQAVAAARAAFAELEEGDRGWCRPTLERLLGDAS